MHITAGMHKHHKKMNFYRQAIALLLALILMMPMTVSCGQDTIPDKHASGVVREGVLDYGPYLFFPYRILFQYNRTTNTVTRMCRNPECNGECPLDALAVWPHFVDRNNLYFSAVDFNMNIMHGYVDILTDEVTVLKNLTRAEDPLNAYNMAIDGDYVYYQAKLLKEGGNKSSIQDYENFLCRIPKNGGAEERVFKSGNMLLQAATPYGIVMSDDVSLHLVDYSSWESSLICDLSVIGYCGWHTAAQYYDGELYFCANHVDGQTLSSHLLKLNVATREVEKLVANPVEEFALTESGIYYLPVPEAQILGDDGDSGAYPSVLVEREELRYCDFDGENDQISLTVLYTMFNQFTVIDNILYGSIITWNSEEQGWNKPFFGKADLKTGKITAAEGSTDHEMPKKK